jgi:hypothetical protein
MITIAGVVVNLILGFCWAGWSVDSIAAAFSFGGAGALIGLALSYQRAMRVTVEAAVEHLIKSGKL